MLELVRLITKITNIHASIETVALADSVYDNMVAGMIASKGFVEIPFKQYFSFHNTHTGSSRFTVASQSLDRIWMAWRLGSLQHDSMHPTLFQATRPPLAKTHPMITAALLSAYGGVHGTGATEKYITEYQRFAEPGAADALKYQIQLKWKRCIHSTRQAQRTCTR